MSIVGRLAPSPTGAQHVGNARTYLIAWLAARAAGGRVVLRIEDIDTWRNKADAVPQLYDDLNRLGLDWDGDATLQSANLDRHEAALRELQRQELVYPCTCTRTDIINASSAPHAEHEPPPYPGTCAHRTVSDAATLTKPYAWRFRVSDVPVFDDLFCGSTRLSRYEIGGDFVVWRSFQAPAYQLAVVTDDAAAGVTQVVRGDDLVSSTPRQLLLYRTFGLPEPTFAHVPLVVGKDGRRLAKRHGDTRLQSLWQQGISPEQFLGQLAYSCGWIDLPVPITAKDLIPHFRWDTIPRAPHVWV